MIFIFTIVLLEIYLIERNFIHHVSSNHELLPPPPPPPPNNNPLTSIDAAKTTNNKLNPLEDILRKAQINITEDVRHSLPSFSDVQNLYGSEPIIIGLDKCADFRAAVKPEDSFLAPAGMFNTVSIEINIYKYTTMFVTTWNEFHPSYWRQCSIIYTFSFILVYLI